MLPLVSTLQIPPRVYTSVVTRPYTESGVQRFAQWVQDYSWSEIYECEDGHNMAELFQNVLLENYKRCFPTKTLKVCEEDRPWVSVELKKLDRLVKREFSKHKQSEKWVKLKEQFEAKSLIEKQRYFSNMVSDLKTSNPGQWYSKVKLMSGKSENQKQYILVDELTGLNDIEQAECIAEHYSEISNQYEQVKKSDFPNFNPMVHGGCAPPHVEPRKVYQVIQKMNKKAATAQNDVPMKLIAEFGVELAFPLSHMINFYMKNGLYPEIWKIESVTPVPKSFPVEKLKDLRKISGLLNAAKITDKIIGEFIIEDMAPTRDPAQFGNEKKISAQHYLIQMINRIYTAVDRNSQLEAMSVLLTMVDWSQAFDRQSHKRGIESFIKNGVRQSLIPLLISFFQNRQMKVKWNGQVSSSRILNGGGPQGGLMGILEYLSQTNHNTDFLSDEDKFKFIDDLSFLEILNLISQGLCSYNFQAHVPSDISADHNQYLPPNNFQTQDNLNRISEWTDQNQMQLNSAKSKYMVINFTDNYQYNTRLCLGSKLLEQVREDRLLGVIINDKLTWESNTEFIVKKSYKRMIMLHNLFDFGMSEDEMIEIYILYIRSVVECSAVVWHSELTAADRLSIERVQKVALRIILKEGYEDYEHALEVSGLTSLNDRRTKLCKQFATKCTKSLKTCHMFPLNPRSTSLDTRHTEKFYVQHAKTGRLKNSAIPYMQQLLNLS